MHSCKACIDDKKQSKKLLSKPAAHVPSPAPTVTVSHAASKKPAVPTSHGSMIYRTGRIFSNFKHMTFRVQVDYRNNRSDSKFSWKGKTPTAAEWERAIAKIDAHCDGK